MFLVEVCGGRFLAREGKVEVAPEEVGSGVLARDTGYRAWAIMSPCGSEGTY